MGSWGRTPGSVSRTSAGAMGKGMTRSDSSLNPQSSRIHMLWDYRVSKFPTGYCCHFQLSWEPFHRIPSLHLGWFIFKAVFFLPALFSSLSKPWLLQLLQHPPDFWINLWVISLSICSCQLVFSFITHCCPHCAYSTACIPFCIHFTHTRAVSIRNTHCPFPWPSQCPFWGSPQCLWMCVTRIKCSIIPCTNSTDAFLSQLEIPHAS